jgi:hypothetical protein
MIMIFKLYFLYYCNAIYTVYIHLFANLFYSLPVAPNFFMVADK